MVPWGKGGDNVCSHDFLFGPWLFPLFNNIILFVARLVLAVRCVSRRPLTGRHSSLFEAQQAMPQQVMLQQQVMPQQVMPQQVMPQQVMGQDQANNKRALDIVARVHRATLQHWQHVRNQNRLENYLLEVRAKQEIYERAERLRQWQSAAANDAAANDHARAIGWLQ